MTPDDLHHHDPAAGECPAPAFPVVIAEWPRNHREVVRVTLDRYNERHLIAVRSWFRDEAGELRPSRSGITLSVKHLPGLAAGLASALERARQLGLIEAEAQQLEPQS